MNRRERKAALREKQKKDGLSRKTRRAQHRLGRLLIVLTVAAAVINVLFFVLLIRCHIIGVAGENESIAMFAVFYYSAWLVLLSNRWRGEGYAFWPRKSPPPEWMAMSGEEGEFNVRVYRFLTRMMAVFIFINGFLLITVWYGSDGKPANQNEPVRLA